MNTSFTFPKAINQVSFLKPDFVYKPLHIDTKIKSIKAESMVGVYYSCIIILLYLYALFTFLIKKLNVILILYMCWYYIYKSVTTVSNRHRNCRSTLFLYLSLKQDWDLIKNSATLKLVVCYINLEPQYLRAERALNKTIKLISRIFWNLILMENKNFYNK